MVIISTGNNAVHHVMGGEDVKNIENSKYKEAWELLSTFGIILIAAANVSIFGIMGSSSCYYPQPWELRPVNKPCALYLQSGSTYRYEFSCIIATALTEFSRFDSKHDKRRRQKALPWVHHSFIQTDCAYLPDCLRALSWLPTLK
jgi:hypothetical protein